MTVIQMFGNCEVVLHEIGSLRFVNRIIRKRIRKFKALKVLVHQTHWGSYLEV